MRWLISILALAFFLSGVEAKAEILGPSIHASIWMPGDGDNDYCRSGFPIAVTVTNKSFKRLARAKFEMEVWLDGRSKNVLRGNKVRMFDTVVGPFSSEVQCFSDPYFEDLRPKDRGQANAADIIRNANSFMSQYADIASRATVSIKLVSVDYR